MSTTLALIPAFKTIENGQHHYKELTVKPFNDGFQLYYAIAHYTPAFRHTPGEPREQQETIDHAILVPPYAKWSGG